jgi:tungstate transport system substrate-binding protein
MLRAARALAVLTLLVALASASASADTVRVQSTTDTVDAGLLDGLLKPMYAQAHPEDTLQYTAVGTGKALDNARAGLADVVVTHAPSLERQFVADGFSLEPAGRAIFYSDYVIVGPPGDPAGVEAAAPHDAISALEAIATAGGTASFVSRGDNSGTNVQEQLMWGLTSTVVKQVASNAAGAPGRFEPGSGGTYPAWYGKTNQGQAANLETADACSAGTFPNGGCYTMVDRGTFNRLFDNGTITHLAIVSQDNAPAARGGKNLLINPFSVYVVNPAKVAGVDVPAAQRFVDFLTSPQFQAAVDTFPTTTDPAFHSDAFPAATLVSTLPATTSAGSRVTFDLALANRQPGTPAVSAMPIQLQASNDGGTTWKDVGAPRPTDASGDVRFTPTIARTTAYRVSWPSFQATSWNAFSPGTQQLGVVSVPVPPPPVKLDRTAPTLRALVLARGGLTVGMGEPGTLTATVAKRTARRVRSHGRTRTVVTYRRARTASLRVTKAGRVSLHWSRALPAGVYRVALRATDAARNVRVASGTRRISATMPIRR